MATDHDDQRFVHLLQPLRDLAQNWNIDVARDLEEYLTELENISISFDGGKTNVNFAEAALLIQGSACIYSKKVEYLYNLIYKTLDMLMSKDKQRKAKASSINAEGIDTDAMFAAQEEFLLLDDIIEEGRNVDLEEADDEWAAIATAAVTDPRKTPRGPGTHQNLLAKTPLSRMGTYGALSAGSRRSVFRVAGSNLHESSGALLLDHSNEQLLHAGVDQSAGASILQGASPAGSVARGSLFGSDGWRGGLTEADQSATHSEHEVDGGEMFDDGMHDSFAAAPQPQAGAQHAAGGVRVQRSSSVSDPWAAFDLYDDSKVQVETLAGEIKSVGIAGASGARAPRKERPLRIARTSQRLHAPAAIARYGQPVAAARTAAKATAAKSAKAWRDCVPVSILSAVPSAAPGVLREWAPETAPCKPSHAKPVNVELHAMHAAHKKALGRERLLAVAAGAAAEAEGDDGELDMQLDDAWGGGEEGGLDAGFLGDDGAQDACMHLLSEEVVGGGRGADAVAAALRFEEGLPEAGDLDYESKVRGHIDAYMKEATAYATQTALSARVDAWSAKLEPLLAAQEAAPAYDIHAYGAKALGNLAKQQHVACEALPLGRVLQRTCSTDVGRSFLALLQLANEGAVCLVHAGVDEHGQDVSVPDGELGAAVAGDVDGADCDCTLRVALTAQGQQRPAATAVAASTQQQEGIPAGRVRGKKARQALGSIPVGNAPAASPAKKVGRHVSAAPPSEAV